MVLYGSSYLKLAMICLFPSNIGRNELISPPHRQSVGDSVPKAVLAQAAGLARCNLPL